MAIEDPPTVPSPGPPQGEVIIRRVVRNLSQQSEACLAQIKSEIDLHTRANIDTELGATDAAELTTLYNLFKTALDSAPLSKVIPAIPL